MSHEPLEVSSWTAQLLILLVAGVAAYVANGQLKEMGDFRKQRLHIANANLLLELDTRWESPQLYESRLIFAGLRSEILEKVGRENPVIKDAQRIELITNEWKEGLDKKRKEDLLNYGKLMAMCGFFETVGLMVEKKYISAEDMFELFLGPLENIEMCFGGHIAALERETGVLVGLYKHP